MNRELLAMSGRLLYGHRWQATMARVLGVSRRTMVNWAKGAGGPGAPHVTEIKRALATRRNSIEMLLRKL